MSVSFLRTQTLCCLLWPCASSWAVLLSLSGHLTPTGCNTEKGSSDTPDTRGPEARIWEFLRRLMEMRITEKCLYFNFGQKKNVLISCSTNFYWRALSCTHTTHIRVCPTCMQAAGQGWLTSQANFHLSLQERDYLVWNWNTFRILNHHQQDLRTVLKHSWACENMLNEPKETSPCAYVCVLGVVHTGLTFSLMTQWKVF